MSKSKKLTNRIIAVLLIVLGLILGGTWNSAKYCIGDKIFIALGISPWSNGCCSYLRCILKKLFSFSKGMTSKLS